MRNYSLSIYRITLNRRHDKDVAVPLCDFDHGKDLLDMIHAMLAEWQTQGYRTNPSAVPGRYGRDEKETLRVNRIRQNSDGSFALYRTGRYLSGIIESGEYGTEESIIDYATGALKYKKGKGDAPMVPFYFMFNIPENSRYGYLLLERIGNVGIQTVLYKALREIVEDNTGWGYVARVEPFMIRKVFDHNMEVVSDARKVILRDVSHAASALREITETLSDDGIRGDMVFSAGRFRTLKIRPLFDLLRRRENKNAPYSFKGIECADVAFELKIGDKVKTISIGRLSNLGTNMDITGKITEGDDGYPLFDSVNEQAQELLSYIRDEE